MDFKENLNLNPEMIRQVAEKLAREQVEKFKSNSQDGHTQNCNTGHEVPGHRKKEYEKDYSTSWDQANLTPENMKAVLSQSQTITCDECSNHTYMQVMIVKRVSPFVSPTGEEMMIPVQALACTKCNHINKRFATGEIIPDILEKQQKASRPKRKKTNKKKA